MAVSTWYFLALDRPTPPGVFISPVLAMLVTLGLGLVVVRRAQRRGAARSGGEAGRTLIQGAGSGRFGPWARRGWWRARGPRRGPGTPPPPRQAAGATSATAKLPAP